MKFNFEISNIEVSGINLGGIKIETELSINELIAIRQEQERALANLPTYIAQLAEGAKTVNKFNQEFEAEDLVDNLLRGAIHNKLSRQIKTNMKGEF